MRKVLVLACAWLLSAAALAQSGFPVRPVKLVVGFAPGGSVDIAARIVAEALGPRLGQQVVVDNRAGGSGVLASATVAKAEPDGHTLLFASNGALTINPHLAPGQGEPLADFVPVARIARVDALLVVHPDVPAQTFAEFVELLKRQPGKYSFSSSPFGPTHLAGELLKKRAGVAMVHIPYKGDAPALVDTMGGVVPANISVVPSVAKFIQAGKLRALASFGERRLAEFPDLPTLGELGYPGVTAGAWYVILAPQGTAAPAVAHLQRELQAVLKDPQVLTRMRAAGMEPFPSASPQEAGDYIRQEYRKWGTLIREAGIRMSSN